jgi:hypothetical protein
MAIEAEEGQPGVAKARKIVRGKVPGLWPAAAAAVVSGAICFTWLTAGGTAAMAPSAGPNATTSELAQVADQDIPAALQTMLGSPAFLAQFKKDASECRQPLAWVSLAREPGQAFGKVRVRSGAYFSPLVDLTDVPARIAIPFPNRYEEGHGVLQALHAGGGATIALLPAWHVAGPDGAATQAVSWRPGKSCQ